VDSLFEFWRWLKRLLAHPVPPGTDWRYVLGSATLVAFLLQVVTGTVLATVYVPSTADAYHSLQAITNGGGLGRVLRGMHYFGAGAMMIFIGAHIARVFLTGSYKFPRGLNWLSGAVLLLLTLIMAFTGQLLRWDQDGIWSSVIAAEQAARTPGIGAWLAHVILGGQTVGGPTLSRAFATHVFFVPGLIIGLILVHLALLIYNGISERTSLGAPTDPEAYIPWYRELLAKRGRPFWPDAVWRDAITACVLVGAVVALAVIVGPKALGRPPDPTAVNASPRPDWYFEWYFALLAVIPRATEPYVIVLAPLLFGLILVLLPFVAEHGRRRFRDRPWAIVIVAGAIATIAFFWQLGERAPWSPAFGAPALQAQVVGSTDTAVVRGAQLFHDRGCELCHAVGGEGGHHGPDLTTVARRLDHAQIESRILGGGDGMPAYALHLSSGDLGAIVAFLETRR
jgi:ubiquinol-cytochrome c reductase cytochrome b subunit